MTNEYSVYRGVDGGRGRGIRDLEVDDFVGEPFLETRNTFGQVSPCLVLGIGNGEDANFGERMLEDGLEVRREGS
jgi:hypothetical protein